METKKFLDEQGVAFLYKKLSLQDYPNNDTLITVINAIDEGKMDKTTAIPLIEQATAGQVPIVKSIDENGKPVEWETRNLAPELIVPILAYPDYGILLSEVNFQQVDDFAFKNGLDNLKASFFIAGNTLETETEHYQPYYYSISCLKVRDAASDQVIAYDFVFLIDDELKTYRLTSTGTTLHNSIKLPLFKSAEVGQIPTVKEIDENGKPVEWEAQDFTKIPDTTSAKQYLVTNSNGEKVWTDLPMTETININLTDATLIMPGVIQYYGDLSPAEIIEKSRYVGAINLVFIREIRGHKGDQMGVVLDKIKDRGYATFTDANGNRCLRVYFDNYAPIIIDASSEPSFYLDPEYVAPEPIIPETAEPNQYLTTNENGEKVWENKPDIATLQSAIDTLNGTGEGSVHETVTNAVATIVANAPEDFDTLKEVADWIANDTTGSLNLIERVDKVEQDLSDLNIPTEEIEDLYSRLNSNATLGFYCIEDVTIVLNGVSTTYPANSNVEIKLLDTDIFEIVPTSDHSILSLNAFPGALGTYYSWLEGVKQFSNILFNMNDEAFYSKWSQGNQSAYQVQYAQYINCIFWSDNTYVSDVSKRTNYTLYNTSQLPLCYSNIPDNTFKAFFLAFGVTSDPNWGNKAYRDSFAKATWATQAFSYYGARTIGIFGHDDPDFNITLPKDCRGLMYASTAIENAGTFDAINVTNFGAKSGSWRDAFGQCSSLKNLYIKNLKVNLNISWSPINYQSISFIISNAANTNAITISVSPYTYNLLSASDFELATSKNITIELITSNYADDQRFNTVAYTTEDGEFTGDVIAGGNGGSAPVSLKDTANRIVNLTTITAALPSTYETKEQSQDKIIKTESKIYQSTNVINSRIDHLLIETTEEDIQALFN